MPLHPLRVWLWERRITLQEFAKEVDASQGMLSLLLGGRRRPSRELARRISIATGREISIEALLGFEVPPSLASGRKKTKSGKTGRPHGPR